MINASSTHTSLTKASAGKGSSTLYPGRGEPKILVNCTNHSQKELIIFQITIYYQKFKSNKLVLKRKGIVIDHKKII